MKPLALLVSLSLLGFTVASCGDDEETQPTEDASSQQAFVAEASKICADVNQKLDKIQSFPKEGPPIINEGLSDLEGLTPPPDQQETFDQFVQEGQDAVQSLENAEEPPQGDPFGQFTRLGQQLGIDGGCTEAGQGPS